MLELQAASVAGPDERQPIVTANIAIVLIERAHQLILRRRRTLPAVVRLRVGPSGSAIRPGAGWLWHFLFATMNLPAPRIE